MATKFFDLNEAAKALGVTPDQLMEMRQRGDIHGYRDGASWKFKAEEVERVKQEQGAPADSDQYSEDFQHLIPAPSPEDDAASGEDSVSILVSEEALGKSPQTSSSTIIGKSGVKSDEGKVNLAGEGSDHSGSLLSLDEEAGSSDLKLSSDSGVLTGKEMELDKSSGGTSELQLSAEKSDSLGSGSLTIEGSDLALGEGSELSLGEDSDDLVLGGGGAGSDVSLDPAGSGINLAKPNESGLSLEEPLELGGSHVESLELPEDEDMVSLADAAVADPDSATMLKADEEFALGPQVGSMGEDSSDSGSQVIALEDSEGFDESAATMLAPGEAEVTPLVAVAPGGGVEFGAAPAAGLGPALVSPAQGPGFAAAPAAPPEAAYSLWNVLGLLCVVMVMALTGILMVDVLRNMWAFDGTYSVSSSVMDSIIDLLKM